MRPEQRFVVSAFLWLLLFACGIAAAQQAAPVTRSPGDLTNRLARIERLLDSQALFELAMRLDTLQSEVQFLRGELEQQGYALEQLRKQQRDLYVDIDRRLQGVERGKPIDTAAALPQTSVIGSGDPPLQTLAGVRTPENAGAATLDSGPALSVVIAQQPTAPADKPPQVVAVVQPGPDMTATAPAMVTAPADESLAEAAYNQAFGLLKAGEYDESIAALNGFLVEFPSSRYSDNAQYWLGEAYYVTRSFEAGIAEYTKLIQSYPQSQKVTHSLLKIGYCQFELGNLDAATAQLEDLKDRYPGTTAARLAEERLQQIRLAAQR